MMGNDLDTTGFEFKPKLNLFKFFWLTVLLIYAVIPLWQLFRMQNDIIFFMDYYSYSQFMDGLGLLIGLFLFFSLLIIMLLVTEAIILCTILWLLFGVETLEISLDTISINKKLLTYHKANTYLKKDIKNIRHIKLREQYNTVLSGLIGRYRVIQFEYQENTVWFGFRVSETEAGNYIEKIIP